MRQQPMKKLDKWRLATLMDRAMDQGLAARWSLERVRQEYAHAVYLECDESLNAAAHALGMARSTLREMLKRLDAARSQLPLRLVS